MTLSIFEGGSGGGNRWIIGIKISTIGDSSTSPIDGRYRLASGVPTWDSSNMYRSALVGWPAEITSTVDYRGGATTIGGLDLDLLRTDEVAGWLQRVRFNKVSQLNLGIAAAGTTVVLDTAVGEGVDVVIGREVLLLGTESGAGPYTYTDCARGRLGTIDAAHGETGVSIALQPLVDAEVYLAGEAPIYDLPVELFVVDAVDGGYDDEETLWTGVIHGVLWDGAKGALRLTLDSALDILGRTTLLRRQWRSRGGAGTLAWRGSGEPVGDTMTHTPGDDEITYRTCLLYDGTYCLRSGVRRIGVGPEWMHSLTGRDVPADPVLFGGGAPLPPAADDGGIGYFGDQFRQVFAAAPGAPAVNDAGATLSTNAITLALQLLTTTATGGNGAYDLGVEDLGCGIPASLIDVAGMEALAAIAGDGVDLDAWFLGLAGKPVKAVDAIDSAILAFGLRLAPREGGKIGLAWLVDGAMDTTAIGEAALMEPPATDYRAVPAVSEVTVSWDERPGLEARSSVFRAGYSVSRSVGGANTAIEIKAPGIRSARVAEALGQDWTTLYYVPIPVVTLVARRTVSLWPGDAVQLTHGVMSDAVGVRGLVDGGGVVASRTLSLEAGTIRYTIWWTGARYGRIGRIGPSARVASYSAPDVTAEVNAFTSALGSPATDTAAWTALITLAGSLAVLILDSDLSVRGTATLTTASGTTLTLSAPTVDPVAGDVIVLAAYDAVGAEEQARYAYLAAAAETLGSASDDAYEWTT